MTEFLLRFRLLGSLCFFMLDLVVVYLQQFRPLIWSLTIVILLAIGLGHSFLSTAEQVKLEQITPISLSKTVPHQAENFTRSELEQRLTAYQELLKTQPNHRDVLVNIALLEKALRNQKDAYLAWEEARELDPNNIIFTSPE